jgi:hypothetical protein
VSHGFTLKAFVNIDFCFTGGEFELQNALSAFNGAVCSALSDSPSLWHSSPAQGSWAEFSPVASSLRRRIHITWSDIHHRICNGSRDHMGRLSAEVRGAHMKA